MYVQVAHYELGRGSVAELRSRVEQGPVKLMAEVPGFVDYYTLPSRESGTLGRRRRHALSAQCQSA
jgi:hypothetical protein